MSRVIHIDDQNVIPLNVALRQSVRRADEVDLAGELMNCAGELHGCGESIRQCAILDDQPSIFMLADALAILHAAERAVCVYAVARGLKLAMTPVPPPCDVEG